MAVSEYGEVLGSLSGGCVEGDVFERSGAVLATGRAELATYGISENEAFAVGLTCGGELEVLIEPVDDRTFADVDEVLRCLREQLPVVVATWMPDAEGRCRHEVLGSAEHDSAGRRGPGVGARRHLSGLLGTTTARLVEFCESSDEHRDGTAFVHAAAQPARMIIFGAVDFAAALSRMGSFLGYRVTICDARPVFATVDRFPDADEVVVDWPHRYLEGQVVEESTVLCVLTHDPKFDVPLLEVAVRTAAGYVGVMGSRRSHESRLRRLRENGVSESEISRLRSPIGLDLGGSSPEQTAVSIAAEIIAATTGRTGMPLRDLTSAIHDGRLSRDDRLRA
jgi:xanthine dehydrogenase accessory factor